MPGKNNPQLVHIHIPKCGGKTFREVCVNQFEDSKTIHILGSGIGVIEPSIKKANVVTGHFRFWWVLPYLNKHRMIFTWLRDPLERAKSHYNYWTRIHGSVNAAIRVRDENWTFDEFIKREDEEKDPWLFAYLSFFGVKEAGRQSIQSMIDNAKETLQMCDFVGITEHFKKDLKRLNKDFGFVIKYQTKNVTPDWAKRIEITEQEAEEYREILWPEYEIYNYAVGLANDQRGM